MSFIDVSVWLTHSDRSKEAGGLETRPGVLGTILRLLNMSTEYPNCSNSAGEFLWEVCGGDGE